MDRQKVCTCSELPDNELLDESVGGSVQDKQGMGVGDQGRLIVLFAKIDAYVLYNFCLRLRRWKI